MSAMISYDRVLEAAYRFIECLLFDAKANEEPTYYEYTEMPKTPKNKARCKKELFTYNDFLESFPGLLTKSGLKHQIMKNETLTKESVKIDGKTVVLFCPLEMLEQIERTCKSPQTKKRAQQYLDVFYQCD